MVVIEGCTRTSYKGMMICVCSFVINTLVMGIVCNFGVMLPTFLDEFNAGRTITGKLYLGNLHCTLPQFE